MKKSHFLLFCFLFITSTYSYSQITDFGNGDRISLDSVSSNNEIDVKLNGKTKYTDYKIISFKGNTTYIDTTLNIKKEYKFNFLRKDNFELLAFHNQGQTFTSLGYNFKTNSFIPDIGFTAKQFNYFNIEDINYYKVPTPTTEILYRTGIQQGQVLDVLYTTNFSKRFNVALGYKGLRSLGNYRNSLASQGNFWVSFNYKTVQNQYSLKGHITNQDITNQESGGITDSMVTAFIEDNPDFSDRGRMDVNLNNAESLLEGKRLYFEHDFKLFSTKDSVNQANFSNLKVGHAFTRDSKFFRFTHTSPNTTFFGAANTTSSINNKTTYLVYNNEVFLDFNSKYVLGRFRVKSNYISYNYGYESLINNNSSITKNRLKGDALSFGADWNAKIKNFHLNASAKIIPGTGRLSGNQFSGEAFYKKDSTFTIKAHLSLSSKSPNFNYLLYQSSYNNYNWENNFSNINTRSLGGAFISKWGNVSLDITNIDNYTYFDTDNAPKQAGVNVNYLKLKIFKEFTFGRFALNNTLMYQNVSSGSSVFRVPDFVTRNTLYYTDYWFKGNPLQVQIGTTIKYFSDFKANAYNPLLGEFTLQNNTEIGFPSIDVFFNAQVRRTRIYFKADNLSSFFLKKNYFSAPNYPYRDFVIRFGVVWNWFI